MSLQVAQEILHGSLQDGYVFLREFKEAMITAPAQKTPRLSGEVVMIHSKYPRTRAT